MNRQRIMTVVLAFSLTLLTVTGTAGQEVDAPISPSEFIDLSTDLMRMERFYSGGNGDLVTFDAKSAVAQGFKSESVALATELAAYTNALIVAAQHAIEVDGETTALPVSLADYQRVQAYFAAATELAQSAANGGANPEGWCSPSLTDAACTCGHWQYPRPSSAAPWRNWTSSNPSTTLTSWGYHTTPDWAGGGWTRPQTYYPSFIP